MARIGFAGLGTMGAPMARHLLDAGHDLAVYDVSDQAREAFAGTKAVIAASPAEAARERDYLFTMVPEARHVRAVLFGKDGAAAVMREEAMVVEMSTIDAQASDAIAAELEAAGLRMVDAPVGRAPADARAGTLLVMAGGEAAELAELEPLFRSYADTIVHAGPRGHGIRLKLVNNYMAMVGMVMTAEALTLARKAGLDRDLTVQVLQNTAAGRGQINVNYPKKVLAGDVTPDFPLRMGLKDIGLGLELGAKAGAPLTLGAAAREMFALAGPWGRAGEDCTAMLLLLEDLARCEPTPEKGGSSES